MKNTVSDHHHTMNVNRRDTGIQPLGLEVRGREQESQQLMRVYLGKYVPFIQSSCFIGEKNCLHFRFIILMHLFRNSKPFSLPFTSSFIFLSFASTTYIFSTTLFSSSSLSLLLLLHLLLVNSPLLHFSSHSSWPSSHTPPPPPPLLISLFFIILFLLLSISLTSFFFQFLPSIPLSRLFFLCLLLISRYLILQFLLISNLLGFSICLLDFRLFLKVKVNLSL